MELSEIAIVGNVSNVLVWVGLRALLGLYPGYGIDQVEELRRQTYAVGATLAIISIFALLSYWRFTLTSAAGYGLSEPPIVGSASATFREAGDDASWGVG